MDPLVVEGEQQERRGCGRRRERDELEGPVKQGEACGRDVLGHEAEEKKKELEMEARADLGIIRGAIGY